MTSIFHSRTFPKVQGGMGRAGGESFRRKGAQEALSSCSGKAFDLSSSDLQLSRNQKLYFSPNDCNCVNLIPDMGTIPIPVLKSVNSNYIF